MYKRQDIFWIPTAFFAAVKPALILSVLQYRCSVVTQKFCIGVIRFQKLFFDASVLRWSLVW